MIINAMRRRTKSIGKKRNKGIDDGGSHGDDSEEKLLKAKRI